MCQSISKNDQILLIETLEELRSELGGTLVENLPPILRINEQRGRFCRYLKLNPSGTAQTYILNVAHHYKMDCDYLMQIQLQKDTEVWLLLLEKIRQWIYRFLGRWHLNEPTRMRYTIEIARESGLQIMRAHYPYDCEFDAWACKITQHTSSKYVQRHKSSYVIEEIDLSEIDEWLKNRMNATDNNPEIQFATRQLLLDAIEKLSENQKVVIWWFYFEGRPLPQIAEDLGINVNAIYKRHFDALKQLRKILEEDQYKDE